MKLLKYICSLTTFLPVMFMQAQSLSVAQHRFMNMDVLRLLEEYEMNSPVYDDEQRNAFIRLFDDASLPIYNDLLGLSGAASLTVNEYADLLRKKAVAPGVIIKNLRHGIPYKEGDRWMMEVTFEKSIEYTNICDVLFSSKEHYNVDHQLVALVAWEPKQRKCQFVQLMGKIESDTPPLPEEYIIFTQTSPYDTLLICNGERIKYNYFGQAFLNKDSEFSYPYDSDVHIRLVEEDSDCNMVSMSYTPKRWRVKPHMDFALGQCYKIRSSLPNMKTSSKSKVFGADLGYMFPSDKKTRWGFFFGWALRKTTIESSIADLHYSYMTDEDVDGDEYKRNYAFRDVKYLTTMSELSVPLYFDVDIRFAQRISMYLDFGIKGNAELSTPKTTFDAMYTTSGTYDEYGGITLDAGTFGGDYILNDFVTDEKIHRDNVYSYSSNNTFEYTLDAFAGLGMRVRVYENLFVDLGYSYQFNAVDSHNWSAIYFISTNTSKIGNKPVTYKINEIKDGIAKGTEYVKSVTDFYSEIDRNAHQLNVGIMFRF